MADGQKTRRITCENEDKKDIYFISCFDIRKFKSSVNLK